MIDEEKTLEQFGYTSDSLTKGSHKKIIVICNGCGKERILSFYCYKDLCLSCATSGKNNPMFNIHRYGKDNPFYGKNHSKEFKQKMSNRKVSIETRQKMSKSAMVKKFSKKHRDNLSKANSGKNNPMYGVHRYGEKSPGWQGGISFEPYCINFNNKIKEQVREEFNRKCFLCGMSENNCKIKLHVHHVDYNKNQGCNSDWKLIPLCNSCHSKTSGKYVRDYYEGFISRLLYIRELILEYDSKIDYRSIGI